MLKHIRKNTKLILWILLLLIVPPFVFFGIENAFVKSDDPLVGIIFGKKIRYSDFLRSKNFVTTLVLLNQSEQVDSTFLDHMAWRRIIFLEKAHDSGLLVNNQELSDAIIKFFSFDQFDAKRYEAFVKNVLKMSVYDFESFYRDTLLIDKFQNNLSKLVQLSDGETKVLYDYQNEKLDIRYCEIPFDRFLKDVQITDKEIEIFYSENKDDFKVGEQRKTNYYSIPVSDFETGIEITRESIEEFYQKNKESFQKPFNEVSKDIEKELKKKAARKKCLKMAQKIYAKIVKKQSSDKILYQIQQTGFFPKSEPFDLWKERPALIENLFNQSLNEPLEPILIGDTYYIVIPIEEKPAFLPKVEEVKDKVKEILMEKKARELSKKRAEEVLGLVASLMREKDESFIKACQEAGEKAIEVKPFSRMESRFLMAADPAIISDAWQTPVNEISKTVETKRGYAFLWVMRSIKPKQEKYDQEKEKFKELLRNQKKQSVLYDYYDWLFMQCSLKEIKQSRS